MIFIDHPPLTSLPVARRKISWRDNGKQVFHSFLTLFFEDRTPSCASGVPREIPSDYFTGACLAY
jgi:hypothetical protein